MTISHKGIIHQNCKLSKCGEYIIASNNFTKFKIENCTIISRDELVSISHQKYKV